MRCPECGLENPPIALRCDCGFKFASSPTELRPRSRSKWRPTSLGIWLPRIGAAVAAAMLTGIGSSLVFGAAGVPPWLRVLANPGGFLVAIGAPEGSHSSGAIGAAFPILFLSADLVVWWLVAYFAVARPLYYRGSRSAA